MSDRFNRLLAVNRSLKLESSKLKSFYSASEAVNKYAAAHTSTENDFLCD